MYKLVNGDRVLMTDFELAQNKPSIESLLTIKQEQIREEFKAELLAPVKALDLLWNAGFDSALAIDCAERMAEKAGQEKLLLHDSENVSHSLTLAQAQTIAITIGSDYQTKLAIKQKRMRRLAAIDSAAKDAETLIEAV